MRVLLVTSEFPPDVGGIASHVEELARGLVSQVEWVGVVRAIGWASQAVPLPERPYAVFEPRLIKAEPLYRWMLHRWLRRQALRTPFDVAHVHGVRPLAATRGLVAPTIFTNHSSGFLARLHASPRRKRRTARLLGHVSALIAPSDELVEAARAFGYAGPASMIPNGVDPTRFSPGASPVRAKLGIGSDEVVILLARRLARKNGVVWFAKAVARLGHRAFRIVFAGDGEERAAVEAILAESGMLTRSLFLGAVANRDMPDICRAADISVLPSLAEATSIAGLEAMASAVPLVGTRVGGIPTILEDGVTGFLVPPSDPAAMADALDRLIANPELRHRFGDAARAKVEREFAWPIIVRKTVAVYDSCRKHALP